MKQVKLAAVVLLSSLGLACSDDDGGMVMDAGNDSGEITDPLSMPSEPTLSIDSFTPAEECGLCHETHYDEWRKSNHSYAMVDPVYRAVVGVRQQEFDGAQDRFCLLCHSSIGVRGGDVIPGFDFDALAPITLEGVTCEACHKVAALQRPYNSGHVLDPDGPIRGPIEDPSPSPFHESEFSPLHDTSDFCGGCHDIVEISGVNLERPFAEWLESPSAAQGDNCQSCHMPSYEGTAVAGGPTRTLHRHKWVGVDVPFADGFLTEEEQAEVRAEVTELLTGSVSIDLSAPTEIEAGKQVDLLVTVTNNIPAHNFPTGSTFLREAWIEVIAKDGNGTAIYETGTLDANGDLRGFFSALDPYSDSDLLTFHSGLVNSSGTPEIFSWRASEHFSNSLSPLYTRTHTLFIPTSGATTGPISVTARIRFRSFAPFLLRALGLDQYLDKLHITDVDSDTLNVTIAP